MISSSDPWAQWLLQRRHGGNVQQVQAMLDWLYPVRDKVLDHAALQENDTLLDIGTGDGLIAFGALQRQPTCQVIFSDISQELLDHAQELAREMSVLDRCSFVQQDATKLDALADVLVDVVTTRSVLIYVAGKQQAFNECFRVLKPGGRLSIFEPINRFGYPEPPHQFMGVDIVPIQQLADKIKAVHRRYQPPDSDPMLDFDERDLIIFAQQAGFRELHLELRVDVGPAPLKLSWDAQLHSSPNPKLPTLHEVLNEALTPDEVEQFIAFMRPRIETEEHTYRSAVAYMWAVK